MGVTLESRAESKRKKKVGEAEGCRLLRRSARYARVDEFERPGVRAISYGEGGV